VLAFCSGGNPQIVRGLAERSGASVELDRTVHRISLAEAEHSSEGEEAPRYRVHSHESSLSAASFYAAGNHEPLRVEASAEHVDTFDAVVMAVPVELSRIAFDAPLDAHVDRTQRAFQVTHVTLVEARLNPAYFGVQAHALPHLIMTTEDERVPFSSLMAWYRVQEQGEQRGYKIFSRTPISDQLLSELFVDSTWVHRTAFHAYPVLKPQPMPTFRLHDGLFYVNAIESAFSTMETEAIGARNVASLVASYLNTQDTRK
jgi:prenylcysteine oxidase / farnesylcysteine lyase